VKAAICREFGAPITIEDLELASPGPGQIAVKTAACAICHSDIAYAQGKWGGTLPAVYGHEAAGTITDVGAGVKGFSKGDRVLVTLIHACGTCPSCAGGQPTSCDHGWDPIPSPISEKGSEVVQGMKTGGFAEHMVIDQSQCIKLPDDIELDVASLLAVSTPSKAVPSPGPPKSSPLIWRRRNWMPLKISEPPMHCSPRIR